MAFLLPFTVECDTCHRAKTVEARSETDANWQLYLQGWYAVRDQHECIQCRSKKEEAWDVSR